MKLRAYLVDDEPLALERLARLLEATGRVEVVGSATEPEDAVEALRSNLPDVLFLDIQMPRLNGFEVLRSLERQPVVVFTTAYDQYALKAFEVNSVDYLLKPIDRAQLDRALDKIERLRPVGARESVQALLEKLAAGFARPKREYPQRIASRLGDRIRFLDLPRVTHFYAQDKQTLAVAEGKSYFVDHTIAELEAKLDPEKFVRIHRGAVVNVSWIKEVSGLPGGGLNVRLKDANATDLTVARDRVRSFKERLGLPVG